MDDEDDVHEIDARLRAALPPDAEVQRRIAARALANTANAGSRRPSALLAAAALVLVLGAAAWFARRPRQSPPPLTTLSITSRGSMLVVDGDNGRRWVVGRPAEPRPPGRYVIVVAP